MNLGGIWADAVTFLGVQDVLSKIGLFMKEEWRAIRFAQQDRAHLATVAKR